MKILAFLLAFLLPKVFGTLEAYWDSTYVIPHTRTTETCRDELAVKPNFNIRNLYHDIQPDVINVAFADTDIERFVFRL